MRAIELYYQALASASPKEGRKLRLRLADLLLQTGQFASALEQADEILKIRSRRRLRIASTCPGPVWRLTTVAPRVPGTTSARHSKPPSNDRRLMAH